MAKRAKTIDLLRVVDLLQEHITPALCRALFGQVRRTERQRRWTLEYGLEPVRPLAVSVTDEHTMLRQESESSWCTTIRSGTIRALAMTLLRRFLVRAVAEFVAMSAWAACCVTTIRRREV